MISKEDREIFANYNINQDTEEILRHIGDDINVFDNATVCITGAGGFLGTWLVRTLMKSTARVFAYDNKILGYANKLKSPGLHYRWKGADKAKEKSDYIINCAGVASPAHYKSKNLAILDTSYESTKHILELARKSDSKGVLLFSSSEIYANPDSNHIPTPETYIGQISTMSPRSAYDIGKAVVETLGYVYHKEYGVPVTIVRPFNLYGPGFHPQDGRVIANLTYNILHHKPIEIHGDGKQTRTFCYVTDATNGFIKAILYGKRGEAYNIGTSTPEINMTDLVSHMEKIVGKKIEAKFVQDDGVYSKNQPQRRCPDIRKAIRDLGYVPTVNIDEGLQRFYNWAYLTYRD